MKLKLNSFKDSTLRVLLGYFWAILYKLITLKRKLRVLNVLDYHRSLDPTGIHIAICMQVLLDNVAIPLIARK